MIRRIILCIFIFVLFKYIHSQENTVFRFKHFATENCAVEKGLSQNTVRAILQDQRGFLWFGTWDGLNKFDSYKFKIYNKENGLSNTSINCLHEDKNGNLWIGTDYGLNKLNRHSQNITHFFHEPNNFSSLTNNKIYSIAEDSTGKIWIGTERGLNRFDPESKTFTPFLHLPEDNTSIKSNRITKLFFDINNDLWIGTYYGLIRFDITTRILTRFYHRPDDLLSLSSNLIRAIFQDSRGILWIGTEDGLNAFDYHSEQFKSYKKDINNRNSLSDNKIYGLYEDNKGQLWIGTHGGGITIFNQKDHTFVHLQHSSDNANTLSNNKVYSIHEDNTGNIWVGTYSGANKVDRNKPKFRHFNHIPRADNCLSSNIVWSFLQDTSEVLWIATNNGINLYDKKGENFSYIQKQENQQNSISSNKIKTIFRDNEGIFWIGTEDAGVDRFDIKQWEFENFSHNPYSKNTICDNNIWVIFEDSKGYLWIGTDNGLSRYDKNNRLFKSFRHDPLDSNSICGNTIYYIYEDSDGTLLFCTKSGLCSYDILTENFKKYTFTKDHGDVIHNLWIMWIHKDRDGIFWFGTMGEGLLKFDPVRQNVKFFTEKNGLPNNIVYAVLEDENSHLWLSTNWGLSKFEKNTENIINYDIEDGIQGYEFNGGAAYISPDGEMYFGGMNGFNSFFPEDIKSRYYTPALAITDLKIFNKGTNMEFINGDTIHLAYYDNFFSLEFSALNYTNPMKINYAYILENVDRDWIVTDASKRFAEYKNIKPGTYRFKLKCTNSDNNWDNAGIVLTVIIKPPWWNTLAFKILFFGLLFFIILFSIILLFRALKKKHEKEKNVLAIKQQISELERKSLRLQMNPHFIFNSLNSIQSFVVSQDSEKAVHFLAKFSKLMRLILQNSRESYIALSEEIEMLKHYIELERLRFSNKFDFEVVVDRDIDQDFIGIPPMIIQPYIENSIIHGLINKQGKGMISLKFKPDNDSILCIIQDNGIGRENATRIKQESGLQRESSGMRITKERLEILGREINRQFSVGVIDLKDERGEATGTRIELRIFFKEL